MKFPILTALVSIGATASTLRHRQENFDACVEDVLSIFQPPIPPACNTLGFLSNDADVQTCINGLCHNGDSGVLTLTECGNIATIPVACPPS